MNDDDRLTVTLTAAEWNHALSLIGGADLERRVNLIIKIRDQCMTQQMSMEADRAPS